MERRPYRPRADHRRRDGRASRAAAAITTRPARCATWCRTTCMQLLCLVAMEPPASIDADAVRDEKLKVLRALKPIDGGERRQAHRARPVPGRRIGGRRGAGLSGRTAERQDERAPRPSSRSRRRSSNWRWAGVPFYLRTGKRLAERVSEIVIAVRADPAFDLRQPRAPAPSRQPARHPPPARRGREAVADDQGPRPGRHAAARRAARHELRRGLRRAHSGRL